MHIYVFVYQPHNATCCSFTKCSVFLNSYTVFGKGKRKIVFWVFPRRPNIISRRFGTLCRFHLHHLLKMEPTQSSETSAYNVRTPGKYPEDNFSLLQHGESLKTRVSYGFIPSFDERAKTDSSYILTGLPVRQCCILLEATKVIGPGSIVVIATGWTVRGSNPGGGEIFHTCPARPCGPPSLLYNRYRVFPWVKNGRGVTLTSHPLLVPLVMED